MYSQLTLWVSPSVTSSPGLADGPTRSDLPSGPTTSPCGPDPAHVSHSRLQGNRKASTMTATSGPSSLDLSALADLQSSLASKLRRRLEGIGSPVYALTWKEWAMQSGPPICALRASAHRISGSGSIGAGWPTPISADASSVARHGYSGSSHSGTTLTDAARLAGWPTPAATDHKGGYKGGRIKDGKLCIGRLDLAAQIVEPMRFTADGQILTGSDAKTSAGGKLNPALSRWLMGYPPAWCDCAVTATRLYRKSRKRL